MEPFEVRAFHRKQGLAGGGCTRSRGSRQGPKVALIPTQPPTPPSIPDTCCLPHPLHPGDSAFRAIIALGNLDLVITCLFVFYFIFSLTKYGHFLPSMGMERNEEHIYGLVVMKKITQLI